MRRSWRQQTLQTVQERTEVGPGPLTESLRHLRTVVPPLQVQSEETFTGALAWWPHTGVTSEPVGDCFWELIAMGDAADDEILRFAERFGPLYWPESTEDFVLSPSHTRVGAYGVGSESESQRAVTQPATLVEPLWPWKSYARGLNALFQIIDANVMREPVDPRAPGQALAAVAIPILLRTGVAGVEPATEDDLTALIVEHTLDGTHGQEGLPFDQIVTAALQVAGVGVAYVSDRHRAQPVYSLPATVLRRPEPSRWEGLWQVRGLLPILATSLALVARQPERSLCTWCGKPAAILGRRRRGAEHWFGDHAACRAQARTEAVKRVEMKRSLKRRQRPQNEESR